MKVGILGSGAVGQALGAGFVKHGWDVCIGTRDAAKLDKWRAEVGGTVRVDTFAAAAQHGDVVILALNGAGAISALEMAGVESFGGKLVLDATNPLEVDAEGRVGLFVGRDDSLAEQIQRALPNTQVVKCFNTVPSSQMVDPAFANGAPAMLIAGDDGHAKTRAAGILKGLGWPGVLDVGDLQGARWLEALVPLWVRAGVALDTWGHAFRVVQ